MLCLTAWSFLYHLSTCQPQCNNSCQCGVTTLLSAYLFIYLWWWQCTGMHSACSNIVRGLISWRSCRGWRPLYSLQFALNSGNDYQSACVCVVLVKAEHWRPSARHCCDGGMFKTWQMSLVTWHPSPSPGSRSSSLARCIEKLEGRVWEASLNSRDGLPCCSKGSLFACSNLNLATHIASASFSNRPMLLASRETERQLFE